MIIILVSYEQKAAVSFKETIEANSGPINDFICAFVLFGPKI